MHDARKVMTAVVWLGVLPGCATPTATVDLLRVAREGIGSAQTAQAQMHRQQQQLTEGQLRALDAAFDADVRLVAAGGVQTASGEPVTLSPQWVISARKGYVAARDALAEQARRAEADHAVEMDNLAAAEEALRLAEELTVLQWNLGERFKQQFLRMSNFFERSSTDE